MFDSDAVLLPLRLVLIVGGIICIALASGAFRRIQLSDADLRLKLGKEFSKSYWDAIPPIVLMILGAAAVAIAYFRPPSV